jgi:DNA-binding ferritin-like protein
LNASVYEIDAPGIYREEVLRMNTKLHNTQNDQPEGTHVEMVALLDQQLADALDLGMQAKQAHWNVKGQTFIALHELLAKSPKK